MSRAKKFAHALLSSYLFLGANILYTLASVPLALKYLTKPEFGLWALTLQIAGYIAWIDLGMGSSVGRILIDYKDRRAEGLYGAAVKSALRVGLAQGAITLVTGMSLVWFMGTWLRVPADLSSAFVWLMVGQVLISAANFVSRIFYQILVAWQRMDLYNYSQIAQLITGLAALWLGFHLGWGVYGMLLGAVVMWGTGVVICALACHRLGFWPRHGEWGRATREQFRELFSYGADMFFIALGTQLILSSQIVLVSRELGMDAAALWSVMTKALTLVSQIVWRIVGNATPAFAEMMVRREWERLWSRYRSLFVAANVFGGICAVIFAVCNGPFVSLWTQDRFSWPLLNNALLAVWLIIQTQQGCYSNLLASLKEIQGLKYIFIAEGVVFIGVADLILQRTGITGMIVCSVLATLLLTWSNGLWRIARLSKTGWKALLWDCQWPLLRVLAVMVPCALVLQWALRGSPDWLQLAVNAAVLGPLGVWAALRFGLPVELVSEIIGKLPGPLRRLVAALTGRACEQG
jgi:O-antigen/teichoic acid export membrane protein